MTANEILAEVRALANPEGVAGQARFGIRPAHPLGISMESIRQLKRGIPRDHGLALELWASGIHEARILACLVDDPKQVDEAQMEAWVGDFDSWDLCDQCCGNLFAYTALRESKALEWSIREPEFVKRAGFALMAYLATRGPKLPPERLLQFLPAIEREAGDKRNFVRKAVNWALRQIGKRDATLLEPAIAVAERLKESEVQSARWVGSDALKELLRRRHP